MPAPLITVIVVCRNPGPDIREALASVWTQPDTEVVVVDGGSSDGTASWLETQRSRLGALVSEPDNGIYDAMNKGIAVAQGEWLLFLGADDRLIDGAMRKMAQFLRQAISTVVVGVATYQDGRVYPFRGTRSAIRRNFIHHQAAFYRRALFATHGNFEASLRIMGDYDLNLRLLSAGELFQAIPTRVATCAAGGVSDAGGWAGYREEIQVRRRHFPAWRCWLWDLGSLVRYLRKKVIRTLPSHG